MKRISVLALVVVVVMLAVVQIMPVAAFTTVSSYSATCSSFSASGTTNAPYVVFYVEYYDSSSGDYMYYAEVFPNSTGSYSHSISFPAFPTGGSSYYYTWGSPTNSVNDYDDEDYFYAELSCQPAQAPGIPAGFVLRPIWCDVAVYNTPNGSPVGSARIRANQTWFVNPVPVPGSDGRDWTEIFAGGFTNGYIPTVCVS
jgi:hypothetical protein